MQATVSNANEGDTGGSFQYSAQESFIGTLSCSFIKVQDWFILLIYIVSNSRLKE